MQMVVGWDALDLERVGGDLKRDGLDKAGNREQGIGIREPRLHRRTSILGEHGPSLSSQR